jgi:hypothetical protein
MNASPDDGDRNALLQFLRQLNSRGNESGPEADPDQIRIQSPDEMNEFVFVTLAAPSYGTLGVFDLAELVKFLVSPSHFTVEDDRNPVAVGL